MTAPQSLDAGTEYVVLARDASGNSWEPIAQESDPENFTFVGRDSAAAIKAAVATFSNPTGTFVAVPSRSWNPVKVTQKVETTLVLEEAAT